MSKPSYYDVSIIGGGPAGAAAARLLASWGHSVIVLDRTHSAMSLGESLPPSCRKLFDVLGVTASIDDAKFYRSSGNTVWWEDREPRSETFMDGLKGISFAVANLTGYLARVVEHHTEASIDEVVKILAANSATYANQS